MSATEKLFQLTDADLARLAMMFQSANLMPAREVHAASYTITDGQLVDGDGNQLRVTLPLREWATARTKAFAISIKVRKKLSAESAYVVYYSINSPWKQAQADTILAARGGHWLANGGSAVHAVPAWLPQATIDAHALAEADFSTDDDGEISVVVEEMVSAIDLTQGA